MENFSDESLNKIIENEEILILEFGASICTACGSIREKLEKYSKDNNIKYIYLPMEKYGHLAASRGFLSFPTVLVYIEGKLYIKESGYFSVRNIIERIERYRNLI